MRRRGFTLIELIVAMAILLVLIYMAFASFSFVSALSKSNQNREVVLEDMSTVLDQVTKELRQTVTVGSFANLGVQYPAPGGTRSVTNISTLNPPYYSFGTNDPGADPGATSPTINNPILTFYVLDDTGVEHRISYSLGVPSSGGIARQYWASQTYEPCEVLYSNEYGTGWKSGVYNQPVTGQVITNFTVIRPLWSNKVIQILIEAMVQDASGKSGKITRVVQVTLRQ